MDVNKEKPFLKFDPAISGYRPSMPTLKFAPAISGYRPSMGIKKRGLGLAF